MPKSQVKAGVEEDEVVGSESKRLEEGQTTLLDWLKLSVGTDSKHKNQNGGGGTAVSKQSKKCERGEMKAHVALCEVCEEPVCSQCATWCQLCGGVFVCHLCFDAK